MAEEKKANTIKEVNLDPRVWEVPYNEDLLSQVLYVYRNNERKGTSTVQTRGDVSGGGRKPWKQKGTGRARVGSTRSPLWIGGGVTFASSTSSRNWSRRINKKMARKATCILLTERLKNNELEFVTLPEAKSTELRSSLLKNVEKNVLLVTDSENVVLALRNVSNVNIMSAKKLNAKHLAGFKKILMDKDVVKILEERLIDGK